MVEAVRMAAGPRTREWASQYGFSEALVARFLKVAEGAGLDTGARQRALEGLRRRPPRYIRANPLRTRPGILAKRLEARGFKLAATKMDPCMYRVLDAPISQGATLEHLLGHSTPQDLASAAAGIALDARPGQTIADLAAAPGIKTLHIAGDMLDTGALVATEPDPERFRALRLNLERGGASCTLLRPHEAQSLPGEAWADGVLLDAPCTGEGTLPKDRKRRRMELGEVGRLSALQEEMLQSADRILRPGGVLVYATCTFSPEENEAHVARLLAQGYSMEPVGIDACEGVPLGHGITSWPGLELPDEVRHARRFFPGIHPTLGFFVARLRKGGA